MIDVGPAEASWFPTYGELIGAIALFITTSQIILGYLRSIKAMAAAAASRESLWAKSVEVSKEVKVVADALAEHKLTIAREYVENAVLVRVETRLFTAISEVTVAIHGISDRLDRAIDRPSAIKRT
jgi:hypothetical protein